MCGIFAARNCKNASQIVYAGLHLEQHRGTDGAGIVSSDGVNMFSRFGAGILQRVFEKPADIDRLRGYNALGHVRYSTVTDEFADDNIQPLRGVFQFQDKAQEVALGHNGNLVNVGHLRSQLEVAGIQMKTSVDTEVILRLFCLSKAQKIEDRVFEAVKDLRGAFSLVFLFGDTLVAVKDPYGFRPLSLGRRDGSWFISSETVAFDNLRIDTVRQVERGEIVIIDQDGLRSFFFDESRLDTKPIPHRSAQCIFEPIYFAGVGSKVFNLSVLDFRENAGRKLCQKCPVPKDSRVVGVPDSALCHTDGFVSGDVSLHSVRGVVRSHFVDRTFILPTNELRVNKITRKFIVVGELIAGRAVTIVDDSIVRMNTLTSLIKLVKWFNPSRMDVRIIAPPIRGICCFGIDTPKLEELAAAKFSLEEMRLELGVDSLEFLSVEDLRSLVPNPDDFCYACMDGNYPITPQLPSGERYFAPA